MGSEVAGQDGCKRRAGVLLLVDDEPIVLRATARLLALHGYEVHVAASEAEAISRAKGLDSPVDLVLVDLWMIPGTGADLAKRMADEGLASRFIFITASAGDHSQLPGPVLMKPFSGDELVGVIAELLAR